MQLNSNIVIYEKLINNIKLELPKEKTWKNFSRVWGDSMHRICSYVAMFSPSLADYFIQKLEWQPFLGLFFGRHLFLIINWS